MPYNRPSWATAIKQRFTKSLSSLGKASDAVKQMDTEGVPLSAIPSPDAARRSVAMPVYDTKSVNLSDTSKPVSGNRAFNITGSKPSLFNTVISGGQIALRDVGKVLEKTDPSQVIGAVKGTVKETVRSAGRFTGSLALAGQMWSDKIVRKLILEGKLSKKELEQLDARNNEMYLQTLKDLGYDLNGSDVNAKFRQTVGGDAFNVATTAATLAPVAEVGIAAVKAAPATGKILSSTLSTLVVDTVGNVFADTNTKSVVSYFLKEGAKQILKTTEALFKPVVLTAYKQGMTLELVNEARKLIDPETAARIERDQREFVDSLSLSERLLLDLGLGLYLPFDIPGLKTTWKVISDGNDAVKAAMVSRAFDKSFSDAKSLEVLKRLSEFKNLLPSGASGLDADIQLKSNLLKHLLQVMDEDAVGVTVEHAAEVMNSWAKAPTPDILAMLKRAEIEGTATHLSWYSEKLGRALEPHERLMHWFVTETEGRYVGDLGEDLAARFENAIKLRTSGIPETTEVVKRTVSKLEDIKLLPSPIGVDPLYSGVGASTRQTLDSMLLCKADLLTALRRELQRVGSDVLFKDGGIIVPDQFKDIPQIRDIIDQIKSVNGEINDTISIARTMGVTEKILTTPNTEWLLKQAEAYDKYNNILVSAEGAQAARDIFQGIDTSKVGLIKSFVERNAIHRDRLFDSRYGGKLTTIFEDAVSEYRNLVNPDATQDEVLDFLLSLPTKQDTVAKIPRDVTKILTKAEKEAMKMNDIVSKFDQELLNITRQAPEMLPQQKVTEIVEEVRKVEAQLPRGAFAPEFISKETRWGSGVTPIPLADEAISPPEWANTIAALSDANGVTRKVVDYLTPHNPNDIYVKAMNRLSSELERQAPGRSAEIMREISKIQDQGISLVPLMPGGGPKWEALGKPMISGVDWKTLDALGKKFGVKGLGRISREAFVNTFTESGFKPGIIDRLRAAPGIGAIYDALYRQWMLTRFAFNPMFHAQQVPEAGIIGALRSFNLPREMSGEYLKAATRNPLVEFSSEEQALYDIAFGRVMKNAGREAVQDADMLRGVTWEERKRLAAFMAEFPVQVRGQLFDMPALKDMDPLTVPEYRDWILEMQKDPNKMAQTIQEALNGTGFDIKQEAVRRALRSTGTEVQKFTTYNLNRSAFEKDLHAFMFPFSYQKKFWSEVGKFTFGGSVARAGAVGQGFQSLSDLNDNPSMMEVRAKYPTMVGWIWSIFPFNPTYPLVDVAKGSFWLGGVRADPSQAVIWDTFVDPEGKYNAFDNTSGAAQKLGGGGVSFWTKQLGESYAELFKNDSPTQQSKYAFLLKRMQLEAELRNKQNK